MRNTFGNNADINSILYVNRFFEKINFANDNVEEVKFSEDKVYIKFKGIEQSLEINNTATKSISIESAQKEIDIAALSEKQATENENYNEEKC